jgi:hypothetical protein
MFENCPKSCTMCFGPHRRRLGKSPEDVEQAVTKLEATADYVTWLASVKPKNINNFGTSVQA